MYQILRCAVHKILVGSASALTSESTAEASFLARRSVHRSAPSDFLLARSCFLLSKYSGAECWRFGALSDVGSSEKTQKRRSKNDANNSGQKVTLTNCAGCRCPPGRRPSWCAVCLCCLLFSSPLTHYRPAMPSGNRNIYFIGSFQFSIFMILKISPLGNLKVNNLGIFQSLKLHILMEKNHSDFY